MMGGKNSELVGAVAGSVIFHAVLIVLLATVFTESSEMVVSEEDLDFVPAELVKELPNTPQMQQVMPKRERPQFELEPVKTSSLLNEDFSSNIDLDELKELEMVDVGSESGMEGADSMVKVAMQERDFIRNYQALIQRTFESRWRQPPGTRVGTVAYLSVRFAPNGDVLSFQMSQKSGNIRFDQSVMRAAALVKRIPRLRDIPPSLFKKHFASMRVRMIKEAN
ncbi:MAG: TonB C-terminal domain-containing protein [Gammaproteobacteria bacterium AqS3]|nr:TonB C-terminal domain-containing protein [Gammaproteobacteria bacterium AqS3]